jgi:four helix bundle protein
MGETPTHAGLRELDVYRCAIEHLAFTFQTLPSLPKGFSALADQWRRAASSIPMNIAEAVGKPSAADRANRFAIARGSAMECGAILDVVRLLDVVEEADVDAAKSLIVRIVEMLSRLCR